MRLLLLITLACLQVTVTPNTHLTYNRNHACDPAQNSWTPYSGYKIQREFMWDTWTQKTSHFMVVTACKFGKYDFEMKVPINSYQDVQWNYTTCTNDKITCLRLARRKIYLNRQLSLYITGTVVGALFVCDDQSIKCKARLPLIADSRRHSWIQWNKWSTTISLRIPLLYTPDILDRKYPKSDRWSNSINALENYEFYRSKSTGRWNKKWSEPWHHLLADYTAILIQKKLVGNEIENFG